MDKQLKEELTDAAFDRWSAFSKVGYVGGCDLMEYEIDFENRTITAVYKPRNPLEVTLDF